ncbi:hypothetical protein ACFL3G_13155 [Planctomycetota bacterium]
MVSQPKTFSYCDIADSNGSGAGWAFDPNYFVDGGGNIDADPCFVDAGDADGNDDQWMTADDGLILTAEIKGVRYLFFQHRMMAAQYVPG